MNAQRRKEIDQLVSELQAIQAGMQGDLDVGSVSSALDGLKDTAETLQQEEQDYFDNMPEAFQQADKGERAQQAVESFQEAIDSLQQAVDGLDTEGKKEEEVESMLEEASENIDNAIGSLNDASS